MPMGGKGKRGDAGGSSSDHLLVPLIRSFLSCRPSAPACFSHLQVLDSDWREVRTIPLDIGPRHWTFDGSHLGGSEAFGGLRAGDRVRVRNCSEEQMEVIPGILREMGVSSADLQPTVSAEGESIRIEDAAEQERVRWHRAFMWPFLD